MGNWSYNPTYRGYMSIITGRDSPCIDTKELRVTKELGTDLWQPETPSVNLSFPAAVFRPQALPTPSSIEIGQLAFQSC